MALTRKSLKAMGLTDEQVDSVVEMHTETVDGLKEKLKAAEEKAAQLDGVQKELDEQKAKAEENAGYKEKYEKAQKDLEKVNGDFEAYKTEQTAKETKAAKDKAARAYFEGKGITGANLAIAMRGAKAEIDALELEGETIKDAKTLDALVDGDFKGLIVTKTTTGAKIATPPANTGGGKLTKEQILAIKDPGERQTAIAKNHQLFGF